MMYGAAMPSIDFSPIVYRSPVSFFDRLPFTNDMYRSARFSGSQLKPQAIRAAADKADAPGIFCTALTSLRLLSCTIPTNVTLVCSQILWQPRRNQLGSLCQDQPIHILAL